MDEELKAMKAWIRNEYDMAAELAYELSQRPADIEVNIGFMRAYLRENYSIIELPFSLELLEKELSNQQRAYVDYYKKEFLEH